MKLSKWLKDNDVTQEALAEALGRSQSHISRVVKHGTPMLALALQIKDFTNGAVTPEDLEPKSKAA